MIHNEINPLSEQVPEKSALRDNHLLFGSNTKAINPEKSTDIQKTRLNLILKGVLSTTDNQILNSAIISSNNQDKLYSINEIVSGEAQLKAVYPDHIILSRNGIKESLYFPDSRIQSIQEHIETRKPKTDRQTNKSSFEQRIQDLKNKLEQASDALP
ncbi:Type II secretion system protein C [invertebrate metagenome]|uniref:Type II secretion system protein C n=1 Tax=invertebrate metagenome TaxID=1711999 RepID=A0A2H9T420_9ZZZZ